MSKPELTELFKLITYLDKDWYPNKDDTLILKDIAKWRLCFMKSSLSNKSPFLLDIEKFINTNILLARQIVFYYINTKLYKIYKHTTPESKVYIGITGQQFAEQRWNDGSGYIDNKPFYADIQKYGWNNITHEILYENLDISLACTIEKDLISKYRSNNPIFGYNLDEGGKKPSISKLWEYDYIYQYRSRRQPIKLVLPKKELPLLSKQVQKWSTPITSIKNLINPWFNDLYVVILNRSSKK